MLDWSEEHKMARAAIRAFAEKEIAPHVEAMERGEMLPYDLLRHMGATFGLPDLVRGAWEARKRKRAQGPAVGEGEGGSERGVGLGDPALLAVLGVEICRVCPGFFLSFGASLGLCGMAIMVKGSDTQRERWALPVLTLEKIGCWGLTEPDSGSDAFGMRTTARPDGEGYVLKGSKTLITNAPYADTMVVYAKLLRDGKEPAVHGFILDRGMQGLATGKPMKKLGHRSSPTGEIFLDDVRVGRDRLLGETEDAAARPQAIGTLQSERQSAPIMALGMIERCLDESVRYAKTRRQFGRPIAEFQLIQEKIARMYVAREIVRSMLFRQIEYERAGTRMPMEEACAMKLYCGETAVQVGLDAIQVLGGYGYLEEGKVEMFVRDAKLLQIGGGTDEVQILTIAKALLRDERPAM